MTEIRQITQKLSQKSVVAGFIKRQIHILNFWFKYYRRGQQKRRLKPFEKISGGRHGLSHFSQLWWDLVKINDILMQKSNIRF